MDPLFLTLGELEAGSKEYWNLELKAVGPEFNVLGFDPHGMTTPFNIFMSLLLIFEVE